MRNNYNRRTEYSVRKKVYKKPSLLKRILTIIAIAFILGIIACCVAFAMLVDTTSWEKFDPNSLTNVNQTLYVYDKDGVEVAGVYNKENRTYVSLDQVPEHVVNAFIAIEDARFYQHKGIDIKRFFGSVWANLKSMSFSQGFSTISQQLIKNTHLSSEKTINRKVQEMYLAVKLEQEYSKDEILEMYLNYIYFGNGAYGIEAAAQSYFGKPASQLTIAEGAMLAGIIKAPGDYAPHINLEKSKTRRDLVISQMYKYGLITEAEENTALQETPNLVVSRPENSEYGQFVDYVLDQASQMLGMSYEEMTASGYKIYTTMDSGLQMSTQISFQNAELFPDAASDGVIPEASAVVVDAKTGAVKVLIGGREYTAKGFNRAVSARRQPGSTIKPILVYGPAIDRFGYTGATPIEDKPININGYEPNNYDDEFSGWVSLREAVSRSINIPAVEVFNDIGVENGKYYAMASGIPFDESDNHLSLALGGFKYGVTPLEIAASYQPYANNGVYSKPYVIEMITDSYGEVLYEHVPEQIQVVSSDTAFMMADILKTTVEDGTAHRVKIGGVEIGGKTGTVSYKSGKGVNDAWVVAFTTEDIVAVWNGFDMPSDVHYMSSSATGGRYPAMMAHEIMTDLYASHVPVGFVVDEGVMKAQIDKVMYEQYHMITIPTNYTPKEMIFTEYFKKSSQPATPSPVWMEPLKVEEIGAVLDEDNYPVVSFVAPQPYIQYLVVRQAENSESTSAYIVSSLQNVSGIVSYTDISADGGQYKYYIIPANPYILMDDGGFLQGEYSDAVSVNVPIREEPEVEETPEPSAEVQATSSPEISPTPEVSPTPSHTPEESAAG
ncbi:MAG: PBP1A family penicillin-binding protein [Eubacteriales bacterium]